MEATSQASLPSKSERTKGSDVAGKAPKPPATIRTRRRLSHTKLGESHGILHVDNRVEPGKSRTSLVTRRQAYRRRGRRKQILIGAAIILGLFPPMWAVYLIAWLIWRSRRPQQSIAAGP